MALQYSPRLITDGLVMCLDSSQNKSYPTTDLPVKNGLLLWLDASDDSTFSYSSGTEVSQWRDKSGNNFHANQSNSSYQPSRSSIINSRKGVNFNAGNLDNLIISSGISLPTDASIFIIYKPATQVYNYAVLIDNYHGGGTAGFVIQRVNNLSQFYYANGNGSSFVDASASPWTYTDNVIQLLSLNKSGANATPYISGTAQTTRTVYANTAQVTTALAIGYWGHGGGRYYNGDMCEILIFNRALNSTEMKQVHTYLGQKWGIFNTDRCVFDLSGNGFDFVFNGANPRYNAKAFVSNFNTSTPYAISSFGGQNLTSTILNLIYRDHTVEVAVNPKGFRSVYTYDNALTTQTVQAIVLWTGQHSGLYFAGTDLWYVYWNSASTVVGISCNVASYQDKIMHITATRSGDVLSLYINGNLVAGPTTVAATTAQVAYAQMNIGSAYVGNPTTQGYIWPAQHEYYLVRMYQRALSQSEVVSNYQSFKARFDNNIARENLVLDLDAGNTDSYAGSGATWYDVSGNGYNGTLIGSPVYTSNNNGGIIFDSNAKYGTLPTSGLAFGTGQFAIEVWVYSTAAVTNNIIYASQSSNVAGFIALYYPNGSGFALTDFNAVGVRTTTTHQTAVSQNVWYHVVGVRNASNQYIVYVNGVASTTNATSSATLSASAPQIASNPATTGERFTGTIASLRLYTKQLTAAQVLQNYNATKGRFGL
jgi:hypothetical protein